MSSYSLWRAECLEGDLRRLRAQLAAAERCVEVLRRKRDKHRGAHQRGCACDTCTALAAYDATKEQP